MTTEAAIAGDDIGGVPSSETPMPRVRNINVLIAEQVTMGGRIADAVVRTIGSWRFIIIQSIILFVWIVLNVIGFIKHWDPYPFILLNLALSFQAAYSAPIIMMSQNRQAAKDRMEADEDFRVNVLAEGEITALQQKLDHLTAERWDRLCVLQEEQIEALRELRSALRANERVSEGK